MADDKPRWYQVFHVTADGRHPDTFVSLAPFYLEDYLRERSDGYQWAELHRRFEAVEVDRPPDDWLREQIEAFRTGARSYDRLADQYERMLGE